MLSEKYQWPQKKTKRVLEQGINVARHKCVSEASVMDLTKLWRSQKKKEPPEESLLLCTGITFELDYLHWA